MPTTKKEIEKRQEQSLAKPQTDAEDFLSVATEGADADSYAIPFLVILQKGSPQVDPDDPSYIEGAKKGMIMETVSQHLYHSIEIFQCYFRREMLEWRLRDDGGGLVCRHSPESAPEAKMTEKGAILPNGHQLVDTRQHYVLYRDPSSTDSWKPAVIAFSSTQLKKSRRIMTMIQEQRKAGKIMTFYLSTTSESNDKGSWSGWTVEPYEEVDLRSDSGSRLIADAKEFQHAVRGGKVETDQAWDS